MKFRIVSVPTVNAVVLRGANGADGIVPPIADGTLVGNVSGSAATPIGLAKPAIKTLLNFVEPAELVWSSIGSKPLVFPPSAHSHVVADLPATIAYRDQANTFIASQTISANGGTALQVTQSASWAGSQYAIDAVGYSRLGGLRINGADASGTIVSSSAIGISAGGALNLSGTALTIGGSFRNVTLDATGGGGTDGCLYPSTDVAVNNTQVFLGKSSKRFAGLFVNNVTMSAAGGVNALLTIDSLTIQNSYISGVSRLNFSGGQGRLTDTGSAVRIDAANTGLGYGLNCGAISSSATNMTFNASYAATFTTMSGTALTFGNNTVVSPGSIALGGQALILDWGRAGGFGSDAWLKINGSGSGGGIIQFAPSAALGTPDSGTARVGVLSVSGTPTFVTSGPMQVPSLLTLITNSANSSDGLVLKSTSGTQLGHFTNVYGSSKLYSANVSLTDDDSSWDSTRLKLKTSSIFGFVSGTYGGLDTTLSRNSAGVWQMGLGSTSNASGSLVLTNLTASGTVGFSQSRLQQPSDQVLQTQVYDTTLLAWQETQRSQASPTGAKWSVFGATPIVQQTLPAAATDAATTQTLCNAIRSLLINFGFSN